MKDDGAVVAVGSEVILWSGVNLTTSRALSRVQVSHYVAKPDPVCGLSFWCLQVDWGRRATRQTLYSAVYFQGALRTGSVGGQIYSWAVDESGLLVCHGGPTIHEGPVSSLRSNDQWMFSGSKDGFIKVR